VIKKKNKFSYQKVFKLIINEDNFNYENEFNIVFHTGPYKYIILLNVDNKNFYYDIALTKEINFLSLFPKINQDKNILDYFQKLELFLAALKNNKEEEKIENLYEEIIKLYSKRKGFYLLISLFVNIYENYKHLC